MNITNPTPEYYHRVVTMKTKDGMQPACIVAIYDIPAPIVEGVRNLGWGHDEVREWLSKSKG